MCTENPFGSGGPVIEISDELIAEGLDDVARVYDEDALGYVDLWGKAAALEEGESLAVPITQNVGGKNPPRFRPVIVGGRDMDDRGVISPDHEVRGNDAPTPDAQRAAFLAGPKT